MLKPSTSVLLKKKRDLGIMILTFFKIFLSLRKMPVFNR